MLLKYVIAIVKSKFLKLSAEHQRIELMSLLGIVAGRSSKSNEFRYDNVAAKRNARLALRSLA